MRSTAIFLAPFFSVVFIVLDVIQWIILVWVILSWIVFFTTNTSFRWRYRGAFNLLVTLNDLFNRMARPFLRPFRRMLRNYDMAGIDWSPMLLWLAILLTRALLQGLYGLILSQ